MVFSSAAFMFFFLPAVIAIYWLTPRRYRNAFLLVVSLFFYTWGAGIFVLGLLVSIGVNYTIGVRLERAHEADARLTARRWLAAGVAFNVLLLAWFKYANFGVASWNHVLATLHLPALPWTDVLLPIGISFFTFHALSFLVDLYRGTARHLLSPIDFGLYIAFFPQLIAGPIVRFHEVRDQLASRRETMDAFTAGAYRFVVGLGKKVLIADTVAPIADAVFGTPAGQLSSAPAMLGLVAFTVQLYFDFSGYSDMALGLALMFGIRFPENFDRPYAARSITEFWRRWHMSLSRWFRDYLYIPLGGNRGPALSTYRNLVVVFLITGLWHGAHWTFIAWGAYHGVLLLIERLTGVGRGDQRRGIAWQAITVGLVMGGWILFRSPSLGYAAEFARSLVRVGPPIPSAVIVAAEPLAMLLLAIGCASVLLPATWVTGVRVENPSLWLNRPLRLAIAGAVLPASLAVVLSGSFSPFLYFKF